MIVAPSVSRHAAGLHRHGPQITSAGIQYRLWTAIAKGVVAIVETTGEAAPRTIPLEDAGEGWFCGLDPAGKPGDRYRFRLDDAFDVPDVASRFQPSGVSGPSEIVDSSHFPWLATNWLRPSAERLVIYELHVGTFSQPGTYAGVISHLDHLVELGINAIQLMPLGAFPGQRNWGYDVVLPFAPANAYGTPDELRQLIDQAHGRGLAVIIDVVYNHVCGEPNFLKATCPHYFKPSGSNPWGSLLNFDGEHSEAVRGFFIQNAEYWLNEFHVDGLRLDATHAIEDGSEKHILQEISEAVHRDALVIVEDDRNDAQLLRPVAEGGLGMDAVWADDFHHTVKMKVHPEPMAHFRSYRGSGEEIAETLDHGWLFRGQFFPQWARSRGTECRDREGSQFSYCISNHDQTGNRPLGERLHHMVSPEAYRAVSMFFLLLPYSPMLFMGQEWACEAPFVFFSNHGGDFGKGVSKGRLKEFSYSGAHWPADAVASMPDPESEDAFLRSKLNWGELKGPSHQSMLNLYRECLALRNFDSVLARRGRDHWLAWNEEETVYVRYGDQGRPERLIVCRFDDGAPLADLAPGWELLLSSNEARFGGNGTTFSRSEHTASLSAPETIVLTRNP